MSELTLSQQIAEIGEKLRFEDLPKEVVENSKKMILDVIGNIVCARHLESSKCIAGAVKALGGNPTSTVVGFGFKTSAQMAALANAVMGHSFDMDDDHRKGTQHSTVVVFPACFAVAEQYSKTGKELITAFVFGSEITIRLGEAFLGESYYQGFHPTGTCGVFGATGGVSKLIGLDAKRMTAALGLAGSQSSGLLEYKAQGTWSKRFQAGHPAMSGVLGSYVAETGYTAPTSIWDGEDGFLRAYSYQDKYDANLIIDEFGKRWEMNSNSIKVHACCRFSAPLADCGLDLFRRGVDPDQVDSILARVGKFTIKTLCVPEEKKYHPETEVDAQFSLPYAVACAMVKGKTSIYEFTEEAIKDREVIALAEKVKWVMDPEVEKVYPEYYPCTVEVTMKDGSVISSHVDYPKGDPENPVSWDEAVEKFRFMAGQHLGLVEINRLIELCGKLDELDNIHEIAALIQG